MTTTDPDYLALLRNVLLSPNDDLPRLVLCDWLEEPERTGSVRCGECDGKGWVYDDHGGNIGVTTRCDTCKDTGYVSNGNAERAEFIRVQCGLSKSSPRMAATMYHKQQQRRGEDCLITKCPHCLERKMLLAHCLNWVPRTSDGKNSIAEVILSDKWTFSGRMAVQFTRGFIGKVTLTAEQFEQHAAELFRSHPITEVVLSGKEPFRYFIEIGGRRMNFWTWAVGIPARETFTIDRKIYSFLVYPKNKYTESNDYPTREAALAALSDACVRYGRRLA